MDPPCSSICPAALRSLKHPLWRNQQIRNKIGYPYGLVWPISTCRQPEMIVEQKKKWEVFQGRPVEFQDHI